MADSILTILERRSAEQLMTSLASVERAALETPQGIFAIVLIPSPLLSFLLSFSL